MAKSSNKVTHLFLFSSVFALLCAYIGEFGFHLVPCKLCIYQRIAYWVTASSAIILLRRPSVYGKYFLLLTYLANAGISFYHVGLESGIFPDLLGCTDMGLSGSIEEIKNLLMDSSRVSVSCSVPQFVLFGISLSGWNLVYLCFWILIFFVFGFYREKKK